MKGVSIDEALCAYLKKYHKGQENAASSKELEAAFHVGGTELRRAVNRLRCDSHPICSADAGYFYAAILEMRPVSWATVALTSDRRAA